MSNFRKLGFGDFSGRRHWQFVTEGDLEWRDIVGQLRVDGLL